MLNIPKKIKISNKSSDKSNATIKLLFFVAVFVTCIWILEGQPVPDSDNSTVLEERSLQGKSFRLPPCPFRTLTGCYCPGCGSTRSMICLIHGQICKSFRYNPLVIPFLLVIVGGFAIGFYERFTSRFLTRRYRFELSLAVLFLAVMLMILRNIPLSYFDVIRPPG